jgi:hypothetical protein
LDVALCLSAVRYDFSSVLFVFQKLNRVIWCCVSVSSFYFGVAAWSFASEPSSFVTMLQSVIPIWSQLPVDISDASFFFLFFP